MQELDGANLQIALHFARRRQMPRGRFARMALLWIAIFATAFVVAHMLDQHR